MIDIDGRMDEKDKEGIIRFLQNFINEIESDSYVIDDMSHDIDMMPTFDGSFPLGYKEMYRKLTIIYRVVK
jgi:hypothetical protein